MQRDLGEQGGQRDRLLVELKSWAELNERPGGKTQRHIATGLRLDGTHGAGEAGGKPGGHLEQRAIGGGQLRAGPAGTEGWRDGVPRTSRTPGG